MFSAAGAAPSPSNIKWALSSLSRRPLQQKQPYLICSSSAQIHTFGHDPIALAEKPDDLQRRVLLQTVFLNFAAASVATIPTKANAEQPTNCPADFTISDKVYFEISIDREPVGRIVVGLYNDDVPVGAKRLAEIAVGSRGVSYRKKEFDRITPSYIQNAGVRNFSLSGGVRDAAQFTGGETAEALIPELDRINQRCPNRTKNITGAVSIIVKDPTKPPPKPKLIAKDGKFEVIEEELRPDPNGTQFTIVTQDSPQLDASNLVVGKVIDGFDVLKLISGVRVVKDNTGSPYFKAAKLVGDTRAVVAERGFYRPYSKVAIIRSGRLES